ncbi:MAG TPA: cell division protein ZapA [Defluviitaleaceae bacterium]|jgi:cell division protein ZapA|nr:cell division protein ZapA [Candidatus Epulonipiscium sp.]HOA80955.1 cell division protein ZapA [Defluviitaleaceae bacterium]
MDKKNKIEVIINGKVYTLVGNESEEYIQRVALYIDKKMSEIKKSEAAKSLSTNMIAILTSINVADDLFKLSESMNNLEKRIKNMENTLEDKNKQIKSYQNELANLRKENRELKDTITKQEAEISKRKMELEEYINIFDSNVNNRISGDR